MEIQNFCEYFNIPDDAEFTVRRAGDDTERIQILAEYFDSGTLRRTFYLINFDIALHYKAYKDYKDDDVHYYLLLTCDNTIVTIPPELFQALFNETVSGEWQAEIPKWLAVFSQVCSSSVGKHGVASMIQQFKSLLNNHHIPEIIYDLDFDNLMIGGNASC